MCEDPKRNSKPPTPSDFEGMGHPELQDQRKSTARYNRSGIGAIGTKIIREVIHEKGRATRGKEVYGHLASRWFKPPQILGKSRVYYSPPVSIAVNPNSR